MNYFTSEMADTLINSINKCAKYVYAHIEDPENIDDFKNGLWCELKHSVEIIVTTKREFDENYKNKYFKKLSEEEYVRIDGIFQVLNLDLQEYIFLLYDNKKINFYKQDGIVTIKDATARLQGQIYMFARYIEDVYNKKTGLWEIIKSKLAKCNENKKALNDVDEYIIELEDQLNEMADKSKKEEVLLRSGSETNYLSDGMDDDAAQYPPSHVETERLVSA